MFLGLLLSSYSNMSSSRILIRFFSRFSSYIIFGPSINYIIRFFILPISCFTRLRFLHKIRILSSEEVFVIPFYHDSQGSHGHELQEPRPALAHIITLFLLPPCTQTLAGGDWGWRRSWGEGWGWRREGGWRWLYRVDFNIGFKAFVDFIHICNIDILLPSFANSV